MMVNASTANWFGKFLNYISPLRFANEVGMRRLLKDRDKQINEYILEYFGFTWGGNWCYLAIMIYTTFFFLLGWFVMAYKGRTM